jgi:uncharacterized membrane protein YoaK (UPF0700 family)
LFRHQGKTRTLGHNLKIASLLSFVAGLVNVAGFLAVQRLTTNVTGHFAFFVDEVFKLNFWQGFIYFLYIFFFFLGSFVSGMLTELVARKNERLMYVAPVIIESAMLLLMGIFYRELIKGSPDVIAFCLLFAMGLQNSLVTTISNAAVRTTHLTGLFTDLGIELSQLFFYKSDEHKRKLTSSIKLRLTIISFFFLGGIAGGILYANIHLHVLIIASLLLITGLIYDHIKFRVIQLKRKYRTVETEDI